jgi:cytochrome o ubiquinol oxidase operon protein cyoD
MSAPHSDPLEHPEVRMASGWRYVAGFISTMVLMQAALLVTMRQHLPYTEYVLTVGGLALVSLLGQAGLFFGLDISRAQIWKSVSLVLTVPLFILSVGLTVWMFQSLAERTMLMPTNMSQPTLLQ